MKPSLLAHLLLPLAFVAVSRARYCGMTSSGGSSSCDDSAVCTVQVHATGSFDVELNNTFASPSITLVAPVIHWDCAPACDPTADWCCCGNESHCKAVKKELIANYKPKPIGDGPITCASDFPTIDRLFGYGTNGLVKVAFGGLTCKGEVCSTLLNDSQPHATRCYTKEDNPCKQHGVEDGCVRFEQRGQRHTVCCCSKRDYCTGYVPTVATFDSSHSTARWPASAHPATLHCHQQGGVHDTVPMQTSSATTCEESACASIGYMKGGMLKRTFGCIDRAECTRLFAGNYFSGCGVLYHPSGKGWLCCCSNGDYCNFDQFNSTASALFLPNIASPLSPLSPVADIVKAALTPNVHELLKESERDTMPYEKPPPAAWPRSLLTTPPPPPPATLPSTQANDFPWLIVVIIAVLVILLIIAAIVALLYIKHKRKGKVDVKEASSMILNTEDSSSFGTDKEPTPAMKEARNYDELPMTDTASPTRAPRRKKSFWV